MTFRIQLEGCRETKDFMIRKAVRVPPAISGGSCCWTLPIGTYQALLTRHSLGSCVREACTIPMAISFCLAQSCYANCSDQPRLRSIKAEKTALTSQALAFMISTTVTSVSTKPKEAHLKASNISPEWRMGFSV